MGLQMVGATVLWSYTYMELELFGAGKIWSYTVLDLDICGDRHNLEMQNWSYKRLGRHISGRTYVRS